MLTIGSLFSGIGGLELGLERAGLGPVRWQVEMDAFCWRVLERHWPKARRFAYVEETSALDLCDVDVICGGFPCQDVSVAGKRTGLDGSRSGLWREFRRIVDFKRPRWVVVENVQHTWRKWVPIVRSDLGRLGYATLPLQLSAADVGAWHRRRRVFVLAHADGELLRELSRGWRGQGGQVAAFTEQPSRWSPAPPDLRVDDGIPGGVDRNRALGNAVVPQCAEVVGRALLAVSQKVSHDPASTK